MKPIITLALLSMAFIFCFFTSDLNAQSDSLGVSTATKNPAYPGPMVTDRPSQSELAIVMPKGYFQMENGFSIEDSAPGFLYTYPSTLWKVGVNQYFEVQMLTEYIDIQHEGTEDVHGLLPVQLGFKAKLLDQQGIVPKAAFIGRLSLPGIASKQFETTYVASTLTLAFQHDIGNFGVAYNLGAEWDGEDPRPTFIYTLGAGYVPLKGLSIYIEAYGDVPQQQSKEFHHRLNGGAEYLITDNFAVDLSGGIGLSDNAPEKYVSFGFSYRFKM